MRLQLCQKLVNGVSWKRSHIYQLPDSTDSMEPRRKRWWCKLVETGFQVHRRPCYLAWYGSGEWIFFITVCSCFLPWFHKCNIDAEFSAWVWGLIKEKRWCQQMDSVLLESHSFIHRPLEPFWSRVKAEKDPLVLEQNPKRGMLQKGCAGVSIFCKLPQVRFGFSKYSQGAFIVAQGNSVPRFSGRFLSIMITHRTQRQPSCIHKSQLSSWPKKGQMHSNTSNS